MSNDLIATARAAAEEIKTLTGQRVAVEGLADGDWRLIGPAAADALFGGPPEWESRVTAIRFVEFSHAQPNRFARRSCDKAASVENEKESILGRYRDLHELPVRPFPRTEHERRIAITFDGHVVPFAFGLELLKLNPDALGSLGSLPEVQVARRWEQSAGGERWYAYDYSRPKGEARGLTPDGEWIEADDIDDVRRRWLASR